MKRSILLALLLLSGCGGDQDRLTDEQAMRQAPANAEDVAVVDEGSTEPQDRNAPGQGSDEAVYKALGTEPGWALSVHPDGMLYQGNYGTVRVIEATPANFSPRPGTYRSGRLTITISKGPCSDGMSDRVWRDKVRISVADGSTARGCGGGAVQVNAIEDSSWTVIAINGRPTGGGDSFTMRLSDGRFQGSFGCNSLGGGYSRNGDHLAFDQLIGTQMACGDPADRFEREGTDILSSNVRIEQAGGRIRLVSEAGSIELAPQQEEGPAV